MLDQFKMWLNSQTRQTREYINICVLSLTVWGFLTFLLFLANEK